MQTMEEERELELSALLAAVVRRAVPILLVGILLAACLGILQVKKQNALVLESEQAYDSAEEQRLNEEYENAVAVYEESCETMKQNREKKEEQLASAREYCSSSLKMNLDPYDCYVTTLFTAITGADEALQNERLGETTNARDYVFSALVNRYLWLTNGLDFSQDLGLAKYQDSNDKYVRELVSIEDYGQGVIRITAYEASEKDAEALAVAVYTYLQSCTETISASLYAHTLVLESVVTKNTISDELDEQQQEHRDAIDQLAEEIANLDTALAEPAVPDPADYAYEYAPYAFSSSAVVKYAAIGFLAGIFCAAAVVVLSVVFGGNYLTAYELEQDADVNFLGTPWDEKRILVRLAAKIAGDRCWKQGAEAYLKAQIAPALTGTACLLVASSKKIGEKKAVQLRSFFTACGAAEVLVVPTFLENPEAFAAIERCSCAILLENARAASVKAVSTELIQLKSAEKPIHGFITG